MQSLTWFLMIIALRARSKSQQALPWPVNIMWASAGAIEQLLAGMCETNKLM
jgi:hypothetical protein